jgi:hypothetical protein
MERQPGFGAAVGFYGAAGGQLPDSLPNPALNSLVNSLLNRLLGDAKSLFRRLAPKPFGGWVCL